MKNSTSIPTPAPTRARWATPLSTVLLGLALMGAVSSAHAATFAVTNTQDSGGGSLRAAIIAANDAPTDDTIVFDSQTFAARQTIVLNGSRLQIFNNGKLTLTGPAAGVVVSGAGKNLVFYVDPQAVVEMSRLTVSGGGNVPSGGGIYNAGTLTLSYSTVSGNSARSNGSPQSDGGGIYNAGTLTIANSTIAGNSAAYGGGIYSSGGTLTLFNTTVSNNSAGYFGGGIYNNAHNTSLSNCTFASNSAGSNGGGLHNNFAPGSYSFSVANTLFADNGPKPFSNVNNPGTTGDANHNYSFDTLAAAGLSALSDNGGPTQTMKLAENSPVVNKGDNAKVVGNSDQRGAGYARIIGRIVDVGAFEVGPPNSAPVASAVTGTANVGTGAGIALAATDVDENPLTYSIVSGTLPAGLTLDAKTGLISGTPTNAGKFQLSFKVNDTQGDSNVAALTISVAEKPSLIVTTTADVVDNFDGLTSLREALNVANSDGVDSTIGFDGGVFSTSQNVTLNGAELLIANDGKLTLTGPAAGITVSGDNKSRVFHVDVAAVVEMSNLTIFGGNTTDNGGGIYNDGTLKLTTVTVIDNTAAQGGGIYNNEGALTLSNIVVSNNAAVDGGGIYSLGSLTLSGSSVRSNTAQGAGGGLSIVGTTAISNSSVAGNSAQNAGGGIANAGTLTLSDSLVSGNTTPTYGAGIANTGEMTIANSTIASNTTQGDAGGILNFDNSATLTISNSTVAGNSAQNAGGGILNFSQLALSNVTVSGNSANAGGGIASGQTLTLANATIADNSAPNGGGLYSFGKVDASNTLFAFNGAAPIEGQGFSDPGTTGDANHNYSFATLAAAGLDKLNDNGGSVDTMKLSEDSPVANRGDNAKVTGTTDQRGEPFPRIIGGIVDVGAYESTFVNSPPTVQNFSEKTLEDSVYSFALTDFADAFADVNKRDSLQNVTIVRVPANGKLRLDNVAVKAGQIIASADIERLQYAPSADYNGADSFTYIASDGFDNAADSATVTLDIAPVNDAPSFALGEGIAVDEDAGEQSVANFASDIKAGPANESAQVLNFNVTNDNNALFAVQPAISADGTLSFALAPDANGTATLTVTLQDDGGTDNSGQDTAESQTRTITINAVNDAPTISALAAQTTGEDAATAPIAFKVNDVDNSASALKVTATSDNPALVPASGIVVGDGTLTLTPAADAFGTATITVTVSDGELSNQTSFVLTVNAVNDAPSFELGADQIAAENSGAQSVTGFASAIQAGPANESAQALKFVVTNDNNALFSVQPSIGAEGTLSYTLAPDVAGKATVQVALQDDGGTAGGGVDRSGVRTFAITVTANPLYIGVSLTPAGPFTRDTLTATPRIANGTGVSYSYQWFVNGESVQNGAGNTLDLSQPGFGDKGDRISVTLTARKPGSGASGSATNGATVRNSAPFSFSGTALARSGAEVLIPFKAFGNPGGGDSDGDALFYKRVGGPKNGVGNFVTDDAGNSFLRYQSRAGFVGVEVVRFVSVDDQGRTSNIATLGIDVKGVPLTNPTTEDASATTTAGATIDVPVTGSDPNGGAVTFKRVGGPRNGVGEFVTLADGTTVLRYTSRANFSGVEEVRFVALNAGGRPSGVATIRINVTPSAASALRASESPSAGGA